MRVLITPRSLTADPGDLLRPLEEAGFDLVFGPPGRQPEEEELLQLVRGCAGWIAGIERISEKVIRAGDRLRVISRNGTGIDGIDLDAARRRGVLVKTAPGANAASVAELAIALMLCGLRRIPEAASAVGEGRWFRRMGSELGAATLGIVGCGAVGRMVALAGAAMGARVLGFDIAKDDRFSPHGFAWSGLHDLLEESSIVSLHCPPLPGGRPLLDADRLAAMPKGAGIVNTARANLVDEEVLLAHLNDGGIAWYATDVFDDEPPGLTPLVRHPHVIATPHIGGYTGEARQRAVRVAVENLLSNLASEKPASVAAGAP